MRVFSSKTPKGEPYTYAKKYEGRTITVPVPDHVELKPGTLASVIRQSKVACSCFE